VENLLDVCSLLYNETVRNLSSLFYYFIESLNGVKFHCMSNKSKESLRLNCI